MAGRTHPERELEVLTSGLRQPLLWGQRLSARLLRDGTASPALVLPPRPAAAAVSGDAELIQRLELLAITAPLLDDLRSPERLFRSLIGSHDRALLPGSRCG